MSRQTLNRGHHIKHQADFANIMGGYMYNVFIFDWSIIVERCSASEKLGACRVFASCTKGKGHFYDTSIPHMAIDHYIVLQNWESLQARVSEQRVQRMQLLHPRPRPMGAGGKSALSGPLSGAYLRGGPFLWPAPLALKTFQRTV